jgi:hypothetical protein
MSYSLLEIQELLRTSPADVAKSFARGNHGQAYQILGMDELKRRQDVAKEAKANEAERQMQEPPMIDKYIQMADMAMSIPAAPQAPPPGMMPGGPRPMPPQMPQGVAGLPGAMPQGPPPMAIPPRPPMPPGGPQVPMPPPRGYANGGMVNPQKEVLIQQLMAAGMSPDIAAIEAERMIVEQRLGDARGRIDAIRKVPAQAAIAPAREVDEELSISAQPSGMTLLERLGVHPEGADQAQTLRDVENFRKGKLYPDARPGALMDVLGTGIRENSALAAMYRQLGSGPKSQSELEAAGEMTPRRAPASPPAPPASAPAVASGRGINIERDFPLTFTGEVEEFMSQTPRRTEDSGAPESAREEEKKNLFQRFVQYMQRPDSEQETGLKGIDLATIGLMIAGGDSPDPIQNIGRGGAEGLQMVQSREVQEQDMDMRRKDMKLRRLSAERALRAQESLEEYRRGSIGKQRNLARLNALKAELKAIEDQLENNAFGMEGEQKKRLEGRRDGILLEIRRLGNQGMVGAGSIYDSPDANNFSELEALGVIGQ